MKLNSGYFLMMLIALATACATADQPPEFVWAKKGDSKRADYVMYRNSFTTTGDDECILRIFADSHYHLYVNGSFINFGPVRFYPENPQYDTYNISNRLREGENVVAIKALSTGTNTYQVPLSEPGLIVWGELKNDVQLLHDFRTPGEWVYRKVEGYDRNAPKMSFATGPMEIYDARKDPQNWKNTNFDDSSWVNGSFQKNKKL